MTDIFLIKDSFTDKYKCIHLDELENLNENINLFNGGEKGAGITNYLKNHALEHERTGKSKGYFVIDVDTNEIIVYFSLKCGLLYVPYEDKAELKDRDFLEALIDAIEQGNNGLITEYKAAGIYPDGIFQEYLNTAQVMVEGKKSSNHYAYTTHPAIEIENLCKNLNYSKKEDLPNKFSFFVFWICIVPKIVEVSNVIGSEYAYLFAADRTVCEGTRLIDFYRNYLKFHDMFGLRVIKPEYDLSCKEMLQSIEELKQNMQTIWDEFSI